MTSKKITLDIFTVTLKNIQTNRFEESRINKFLNQTTTTVATIKKISILNMKSGVRVVKTYHASAF